MQKQILIIGGDNGGGSAGDQIMCEAACDFFSKKGYIVYTDAQCVEWESPIPGVHVIQQLRKDSSRSVFSRICNAFFKLYRILMLPLVVKTKYDIPFLRHGNDFKRVLQQTDVVLFSGCGGLTDKYPTNVLMWASIVRCASKLKIPVYISGVGIGPLHKFYLVPLVKYICHTVNFFSVRDKNCSYMWAKKNLKRDNFCWVPDDAAYYDGYETHELTSKGKLNIGVSLMPSLFEDENTINHVAEKFSDISKRNNDIVWHLVSVTHEDYGLLKRLHSRVKESILLPPMTPSATKNAVSQVDIMISARYHGCVFAVSQQIPVIALYYEEYWEHKNQGALSMFGLENLTYHIDVLNSREFDDILDKIINERQQLIHILRKSRESLKDKSYYIHNLIIKEHANNLG